MSNNNYSTTEEKDYKAITDLSKNNTEIDNYSYFINNNKEYPNNNSYNKNNNNLNSINSGINNDINVNNLNPVNNAPLKYKKYNIYEMRKEINNEEKNNFNNFYENNNINNNHNFSRFNSYRDIHYNNEFHSNLNNEIEKNRYKIENEKLVKENMALKNDLNEALNQINKIKEQPLILNPNNNDLKEQLSILQNKIAIYEISLEKTKNKYEKQINYYIQELSNYNNLISIINTFFENISKKYLASTNYNFNIKNNFVNPINANSLNENDFEGKFKKIEIYISNLNTELDKYKSRNINFDSSLINQNLTNEKMDIKEDELKDINNNNSFINKNNAFTNDNNVIFENEIIAKKVRSNSSTKTRTRLNKKEIKKNNSFVKNKKNIKETKDKNSKRKDSKSKDKKSNLDIIKYSRKSHKTFKNSIDIPTKDKKRSKSKTKINKK